MADSTQMMTVLADALRGHGFAVQAGRNKVTGTHWIATHDPSALAGDRMVAVLEPVGDPDAAVSWAPALEDLESELSRRQGRAEASKVCDGCRKALSNVLKERGQDTVRKAYLEAYPDSKLGKFINPLMTFDDVLMGAQPLGRLLGVPDDRLHENACGLVGERYGIPADRVASLASAGTPLIPALEELESSGSLLNEETDELAVSFLSYNDPEILVFDCSAARLAEAALNAVEEGLRDGLGPRAIDLLYCQNLIDSIEFGEPKARHLSARELTASGFFRDTEARSITNVSSSSDLVEIVDVELGININDVVRDAALEAAEQDNGRQSLSGFTKDCRTACTAVEGEGIARPLDGRIQQER